MIEKIYLRVSLLFLLIIIPIHAFGEDEHKDCLDPKSLGDDQRNLAKDMCAIGIGVLRKEGKQYSPPFCKELTKVTVSGKYAVSSGNYESTKMDRSVSLLLDRYLSVRNHILSRSEFNKTSNGAFIITDTGYREGHEAIDRLFQKAPQEIRNFSQDMHEDFLSQLSDSNLKVLKVFHEIFSAGEGVHSEKEYETLSFQKLKGLGSQLTTPEKLTLLRLYGDLFYRQYDNSRVGASITLPSVISGEESLGGLLTTAYKNEKGIYYNQGHSQRKRGICTNIASAQGKIAEAIGLENVYVVTYNTTGPNGHATLVATDPDNSKKVYRIDGAKLGQSIGKEAGTALYQDATDHTLSYKLSRPNGETVASVPTEMMEILVENVGADIRDYDEFSKPAHSQVGVNLEDHGKQANEISQVRGVYARDSHSDYLMIGGDGRFTTESKGKLYSSGSAGAILGYRHVPDKLEEQHVGFLYAHIDAEIGTKLIDEKDAKKENGFELIPYVRGITDGLFSVNQEKNISYDWDYDLSGGIRMKGTVDHNLLLGSDTSVHAKRGYMDNVSSQSGTGQNGIVFDRAVLKADARYRLADNITGVAEGTAVLNQLGTRGRLEAGLAVDNLGGSAYVEGPVSKKIPIYLSGSRPRAGGRFEAKQLMGLPVDLNVKVSKALDKSNDYDASIDMDIIAHSNKIDEKRALRKKLLEEVR